MWIITKDYTENEHYPVIVEIMGPRGCNPDLVQSIAKFEFRMYDDDLLYYSGKSTEYATFDPLDDFGAPNAGCTRIDWLNPQLNRWEIL